VSGSGAAAAGHGVAAGAGGIAIGGQAQVGEISAVGPAGPARPVAGERANPERPVRILWLAANPTDTDPLRLGEEIREIDGALRDAEFRDRFEITQEWAVRVGDLQPALLRYRPDIVHFSGHGTESSEVVLEDESGAARAVPREDLSALFSLLRDNIRCVVLSACYSEAQAQAIAEHIDYVVGMTSAVADADAIEFAKAFYRALGYGRDVETAFRLGTNQLGLDRRDKDIPHLVSIKADAHAIVFASAPEFHVR
jgi:hypothetical protein